MPRLNQNGERHSKTRRLKAVESRAAVKIDASALGDQPTTLAAYFLHVFFFYAARFVDVAQNSLP
jgi:hypothetical protein